MRLVAQQRQRPLVLGSVQKELRGPFAARLALQSLPGLYVRPVLRPVEAIPGVEEQDLDAPTRQVPGGHAARGPASDDDDGMDRSPRHDLHTRRLLCTKGRTLARRICSTAI